MLEFLEYYDEDKPYKFSVYDRSKDTLSLKADLSEEKYVIVPFSSLNIKKLDESEINDDDIKKYYPYDIIKSDPS